MTIPLCRCTAIVPFSTSLNYCYALILRALLLRRKERTALKQTAPPSAPSVANCVAICAGRTRIGAPRRALVVCAARAEHGTSAVHGRVAVGLGMSATVEGTAVTWCSNASASPSGVGVGVVERVKFDNVHCRLTDKRKTNVNYIPNLNKIPFLMIIQSYKCEIENLSV
jgi:hypothetical protein